MEGSRPMRLPVEAHLPTSWDTVPEPLHKSSSATTQEPTVIDK